MGDRPSGLDADQAEYRIVCPDDVEYDRYYGAQALRYARADVARCDEMHDPTRCDGPHRIERCLGWEPVVDIIEVGPPRCDHYTTHVEGCPGCRTRADEIHAHYARTAKTGSGG